MHSKKRVLPKSRIAILLVLLFLGMAAVSGCGADGTVMRSEVALNAGGSGSLAAGADMDRDGIPDSLELALGTDPASIDTDLDGLTDHYELWGVQGLAVGVSGSLDAVPDRDADGLIAALDRDEVGAELLKSTSALENVRIRVSKPGDSLLPNDQDRDYIPSDFELHGFYYEIDPLTGEDWFVKWDGDLSRNYYKTDPTKWSTDGDPWSDWEEATKRNMDQRVKHPGDHPCIPAYPEIYASLVSYTVEMKQDEQIETSEGKAAAEAWENAVENTWEKNIEDEQTHGGYVEFAPPEYTEDSKGFHVEAGYKGSAHHAETTTNGGSCTQDNSELTTQEWSTARTVSGNTLEVARIILNIKLVNVGTLPAHHPRMRFNLVMGDFATHQFVVEYPGELEAKAKSPVDWVVATDGIYTHANPAGKELLLSLYQLRSVQRRVPLFIEPVSFEADTLVAVPDPETGRRAYITTGQWSPYEAAIQNVTAKLSLDFSDVPILGQPMFHGMAAKKVSDVRVFGYNTSGHYMGSPPKVTFADALVWAFETTQGPTGPISTIRDPVSSFVYRASTEGWRLSLDAQVLEHIINAEPGYLGNVFDLPIEPGNPHERTYIVKAPSPAEQKPTIYWATVNPLERAIRAYSFDVNGVKEMRFKPSDAYAGEIMEIGVDPQDTHQQYFYTYHIPPQYKWTGVEKVVAINRNNVEAELPILFEHDQLGFELDSGTMHLSWVPDGSADEWNMVPFNLNGPTITFPPFDVELHQERFGANPLTARLVPVSNAAVYDIEIVADLDQLDYNYLRKRPYQETEQAIPLIAPLYPVSDPLYRNVFAVRTRTGNVALFAPQLTLGGTGDYYVSAVYWRTYEGL